MCVVEKYNLNSAPNHL